MSSISIQKIGITRLNTEAIVNAANEGLWEGGGVCGAIFAEAGSKELTAACNAIGGCKTGNAVVTPGFNLSAKYIIHAVGPRWSGGNSNEPKLLYSAYKQSLIVAKENGIHSIGFPLISAGIFGYPLDQAWRKAIQACSDFIKNYPDYNIDIIFVVLDSKILSVGEKTIKELEAGFVTENHEGSNTSNLDMKSIIGWCEKYLVLFRTIFEDVDLRDDISSYNVYQPSKNHSGLYMILHECMDEAYKSGVVNSDYGNIIQQSGIEERYLQRPTKEWVETLTKEQVIACIAWHFRRDHFSEGSWISDSVANGHMLILVRGLISKKYK